MPLREVIERNSGVFNGAAATVAAVRLPGAPQLVAATATAPRYRCMHVD